MPRYKVYEYGEPKAEGREAIIIAKSKEEAIQKAPFPSWGATARQIDIVNYQSPRCQLNPNDIQDVRDAGCICECCGGGVEAGYRFCTPCQNVCGVR